MGILQRAFGASEAREGLHPRDPALARWYGAGSSASGVVVTEEGALNFSAVWRAVDLLSSHVGMLPFHLLEQTGERSRRKAVDHPLYWLLHEQPNPEMSSFNWRKALMGWVLLWGNYYARIDWSRGGAVKALWPLRSDRMDVLRGTKGQLVYRYHWGGGPAKDLAPGAVLHVRGFTLDGLVGKSVVRHARETVGLALATEEFGGRFFANDARPGIVLKHPGVLGDEAFERLRASYESMHGGLDNSHRVAIFEEGMDVQEVGIPPEDAQFLQTRKFQVTEVARWFGIPPHKLMDLERSTFSNIEHQAIEYVQDSLQPWVTNLEATCALSLLSPAERRKGLAPKIVLDGLLRGDSTSRHGAYAAGMTHGYYTINDVRELEDLNPVEGGDEIFVPLNMVPLGLAGSVQVQDAPAGDGLRGATGVEGRVLSPEGKEQRARATAAARMRLRTEFMPLFEEVMGRVVRREAADVKRFAQKYIASRDDLARFMAWLTDFYEDEHRAFVYKNMHPVYVAYAAAVFRAAAAEVGSDEELEPGEFVDAYAESYAARYTGKQRGLLVDLIERTVAEDGDVLSAVEARMDEWDEQRPAAEARDEAQRSNNALAVLAYGALGVTVKRWVTLGKSCPYCTQLNGRTIGISESFLTKGQSLDGGERGPLVVSGNIGHPPAHSGCDCMTVAG